MHASELIREKALYGLTYRKELELAQRMRELRDAYRPVRQPQRQTAKPKPKKQQACCDGCDTGGTCDNACSARNDPLLREIFDLADQEVLLSRRLGQVRKLKDIRQVAMTATKSYIPAAALDDEELDLKAEIAKLSKERQWLQSRICVANPQHPICQVQM